VPPDLLVPALGIYAGAALGQPAAISIGTNPHYGGTKRRVEAHLLDYEGDLYGQRIVLELWERLRDEAAFDSEAALVEAIERDVERTRAATRPA
jgi:riboflavin kinase / FMN adenylyltransferase